MSKLVLHPIREVEETRGLGSIAERFEAFHRTNPHVLDAVISVTKDLVLQGWRNAGMKMIFERLRWVWAIQTQGDDYKLNNNYTAYYARVVMTLYPEIDGFFRLRRVRVPYTPCWATLDIDPTQYRTPPLTPDRRRALLRKYFGAAKR